MLARATETLNKRQQQQREQRQSLHLSKHDLQHHQEQCYLHFIGPAIALAGKLPAFLAVLAAQALRCAGYDTGLRHSNKSSMHSATCTSLAQPLHWLASCPPFWLCWLQSVPAAAGPASMMDWQIWSSSRSCCAPLCMASTF